MKYEFRLYVMIDNPNSARALENIRRLCEEKLAGNYDLEVINILTDRHSAEIDKIIAIPTLIRRVPRPIRRLVGDLSDPEKVLAELDIPSNGRGVQTSECQELAS